MPPIAKTTKKMVLDGAFSVIKKEGFENLNARSIAKELKCSTQPIMYHYKNMDILKEEIYKLANEYHTQYLMEITPNDNPLLSIGIRYIKFASEESNLFKFIFESNKFENSSFVDLINSNENELDFIFEAIMTEVNINKKDAKKLFETIFVSTHGMASLIANNSMKFDEEYCTKVLKNIFVGILYIIKGD